MSATLLGIVDRLRRPRTALHLGPDERLDGKTVLVTGASRGLGRAIATALGGLGATVIVPVRSLGEETVAAIEAAGGRARALPVDLQRLRSVDEVVERLVRDGVRLDRLVLNAGMVPVASRQTGDGFDAMLQVNFLANVRLVDGLLAGGVLAPAAPAPRVIIVGSEAHRTAEPIADLARVRRYGTGQVVAEYGRTKLCLHTWAVELGRRLDGPGAHIAVHHMCPGAVNSEIAREAPGWSKPVLGLVLRLFFQSPEVAARPAVWLTAARDVGQRTGQYLHMTTPREAGALACDPAEGARIWEQAHRLVG